MSRIVYLLGAGASYDALPTVADDQFKIALGDIHQKIQFFYEQSVHLPDSQIRERLLVALKNLHHLRQGCLNHASVDTYAKMLYLTENTEYRQTKCTIVLFFELYRFFHGKFDKRYDAFFASILKKGEQRFPKDISIISWNYDFEFEKAYMKYSNNKVLVDEVYDELNIIPKNNKNKYRVLGRIVGGVDDLSKDFPILKINGTTGFYDPDGKLIYGFGLTDKKYVNASNEQSNIQSLDYSISKYVQWLQPESKFEPAISFSWEDDNGNLKMFDEIDLAMKGIEALVIIGYSFPYFNRDVDKNILKSFEQSIDRKIYIQDPKADELFENVKQLSSLSKWLINPIKNVNQFYMPHEL